ncbi:MAG: helix-hairpin-helix domain-containing protein [Cyanobacteria bacterium P01_D01_bin.128]
MKQRRDRLLRLSALRQWAIGISRHLLERGRLADPYARFTSANEVAAAGAAGVTIDANRATVDDWLRLPGLSIHQARSLVSLSQGGILFYALEDVAAALSLASQAIEIWRPVLRFYHYDDQSVILPVVVNVNRATVAQLSQVPGIDLYLAQQMIQQRQAFGPYQGFAHLHQRLQLPPSLASQLMHYLRF